MTVEFIKVQNIYYRIAISIQYDVSVSIPFISRLRIAIFIENYISTLILLKLLPGSR